MKARIGQYTVIGVSLIMISFTALAQVSWCPWKVKNHGSCGSWSVINPPGYCTTGSCRDKTTCETVKFGNGPYLGCGEDSVACTALLTEYGPPACSVFIRTYTITCAPSTTQRVYATMACP
jgi:hypothetical protein